METQHTDQSKLLTRIGNTLVVSFPAELTDDCIREISEVFTQSAYDSGVTGAILNFARVCMMDSCIFQEVRNISKAVSLMGVRVVWAALSAGVICALVDLGVPLGDRTITTVATLEQGLALLSGQTRGGK